MYAAKLARGRRDVQGLGRGKAPLLTEVMDVVATSEAGLLSAVTITVRPNYVRVVAK
jgi:hypothetical protein